MKNRVSNACALLLAITLVLSGCNGSGDSGAGTGGGSAAGGTGGGTAFGSPDEVFAAFKKSATNNDLKQFMNCMSSKSQDEFAFGMVMMSAFLPMKYMDDAAKAEALGKEIDTVMSKHGLTKETMEAMDPMAEPDYAKVFAPVKDKAAFVADLYALIAREDPDSPLAMLSNASLKDVKVDGDKASGKLVIDGRDEDINFVKTGGKWLIEMPSPGGPAGDE